MLVSKSFLVTGETTHRDGKIHKDIAEKVDVAINSFLSKLDGELIDLKPSVQIGTTNDTAFITVIVKVSDEVKEDEPAKRGRPRKEDSEK